MINTKNSSHNFLNKIAMVGLVAIFLFSSIFPSQVVHAQSILTLPSPGAMVSLSVGFHPAVVKGVQIYPDDPLRFNFVIDKGDTKFSEEELRDESSKLIKYFLASLTVPEDEMWVNLSPYEEDRIVPPSFGVTEMGRDLLVQDYVLKQIMASLMYPENELGKEFWEQIYQRAFERFGTTDVSVNTFNKVWIVPETARVFENGDRAFVMDSYLKVMLDIDYVAQAQYNRGSWLVARDSSDSSHVPRATDHDLHSRELSDQIIREILIPALEREVNFGANFAKLRQIYHSMILATWFKRNLKESLLGQSYVDRNKTDGIDIEDHNVKEKIYQRYLEAFRLGVYNFVREDYDPTTEQIIPRKYFSGGVTALGLVDNVYDGDDFVTAKDMEHLNGVLFLDRRLVGVHARLDDPDGRIIFTNSSRQAQGVTVNDSMQLPTTSLLMDKDNFMADARSNNGNSVEGGVVWEVGAMVADRKGFFEGADKVYINPGMQGKIIFIGETYGLGSQATKSQKGILVEYLKGGKVIQQWYLFDTAEDHLEYIKAPPASLPVETPDYGSYEDRVKIYLSILEKKKSAKKQITVQELADVVGKKLNVSLTTTQVHTDFFGRSVADQKNLKPFVGTVLVLPRPAEFRGATLAAVELRKKIGEIVSGLEYFIYPSAARKLLKLYDINIHKASMKNHFVRLDLAGFNNISMTILEGAMRTILRYVKDQQGSVLLDEILSYIVQFPSYEKLGGSRKKVFQSALDKLLELNKISKNESSISFLEDLAPKDIEGIRALSKDKRTKDLEKVYFEVLGKEKGYVLYGKWLQTLLPEKYSFALNTIAGHIEKNSILKNNPNVVLKEVEGRRRMVMALLTKFPEEMDIFDVWKFLRRFKAYQNTNLVNLRYVLIKLAVDDYVDLDLKRKKVRFLKPLPENERAIVDIPDNFMLASKDEMAELHIRQIQEVNLAIIEDNEANGVLWDYWSEDRDRDDVRIREAIIKNFDGRERVQDGVIEFVYEDNRVVGYVMYKTAGDSDQLILTLLAVHPKFRKGRKYAIHLMRKVFEEAIRLHKKKVVFNVFTINTRGINFYQRTVPRELSDFVGVPEKDLLDKRTSKVTGREKQVWRFTYTVNLSSLNKFAKNSENFMSLQSSSLDPSFTPGGVDMNPDRLVIEEEGGGARFDLPANRVACPDDNEPCLEYPHSQRIPLNLENITGFMPVIIEMTPVTNLPMLLGLSEGLPENDASGSSNTSYLQLQPARKISFVMAN